MAPGDLPRRHRAPRESAARGHASRGGVILLSLDVGLLTGGISRTSLITAGLVTKGDISLATGIILEEVGWRPTRPDKLAPQIKLALFVSFALKKRMLQVGQKSGVFASG